MRVSLNEIQTLIFKACISIGLPVGISQDASQTAGYVFPRHIGSIQPFADAIFQLDSNSSGPFDAPDAFNGIFRPITTSKTLSSLYTTPTVCDQILVRNNDCNSHSSIALRNLDIPAVMIFGIMFITRYIGNDVCISWRIEQNPSINGLCSNGKLIFNRGSCEELYTITNKSVSLDVPNYNSALNHLHTDNVTSLETLDVDSSTWYLLSEYSERLLVPSSDTSRMTGAGAGTVDTD